MADLFYDSTANFSAVTPKVIVASYYDAPNSSTRDALNVTRYQAFTPSVGGTCEGAMICLFVEEVNADTITVTLQENVATVWTDRVARTYTNTNVVGAHATIGTMIWVYFDFTATYVITAAAGTWRLKLEGSGNNAYAIRNATYLYAVVITTTQAYGSGDNVVIKDGITITMNQTVDPTDLVLGCDSVWTWGAAPAASYELDVATLHPGKDSRLEAGTSGSPISAANRAVVDIAAVDATPTYSGAIDWEVSLYGAKPTSIHTTLSAGAAAAQKNIVTTDDMSADWAIGNTLVILGRENTTGYTRDTIANIVGTTITMTGNLGNQHFSGWGVYNESKIADCGIEIEAFGSSFRRNLGTLQLSGVELQADFYVSLQNSSRTRTRELDTIIGVGNRLINITETSYTNGGTFENIYMYGTWSDGFEVQYQSGATFQDIYIGATSGSKLFELVYITGSTFTRIQISGGTATAGVGYEVIDITNISACTFTSCKIYGSNRATMGIISSTFDICTFDSNGADRNINFEVSSINVTFSSCEFGQDDAATATFGVDGSQLIEILILGGSTFTVSEADLANAITGSFIKAHEYDDTANDHRSWWRYGKMQSVGDGLPDTTRHTVGSALFALRFEPLDDTNSLTWEFTIPTGDIQNLTMTVAVWTKINHANFYAGTHTNPTLTIDYDDGTTITDVASDSTDWQLLSVSFEPTTTYGQLTMTLGAATDASGTDAYVYWDDVSILYPAGVSISLGGLDIWADALPVTPPIATVLSALDVWTVAMSTLTGVGTTGRALRTVLGDTTFIKVLNL